MLLKLGIFFIATGLVKLAIAFVLNVREKREKA